MAARKKRKRAPAKLKVEDAAAKPRRKRAASKTTRFRKIRKLAKGKPPPLVEHCFDLRDAIKVEHAAHTHLSALKKKGLTDPQLKTFSLQIALAKKEEASRGRVSLDAARQTLKDLLGLYRKAAKLACQSLEGLDTTLEETLRVDLSFPENDELLSAYVTGLDAVVTAHANALADRDFPKAKQSSLAAAAATYLAALEQLPEKKSALSEKSADRDTVFKRLRTMTSYLRSVGKTALEGSSRIRDFYRPKAGKKGK